MTGIADYVVVGDGSGQPVDRDCAHVRQVQVVGPAILGACQDCLIEGTRWVHLRHCLECGHVGCCDNSPRRHATGHWHDTSHPLIRSLEPGEVWAWCYADDVMLAPADV